MGRNLAEAGAIDLSPCPLAFRQTFLNSLKGKEVETFASIHSRVEKEALEFSSLQVLSPQLAVPATQVTTLFLYTMLCGQGEPVLNLPLPLLLSLLFKKYLFISTLFQAQTVTKKGPFVSPHLVHLLFSLIPPLSLENTCNYNVRSKE